MFSICDTMDDVAALSRERLMAAIKPCGMVGLGSSGQPLQKLSWIIQLLEAPAQMVEDAPDLQQFAGIGPKVEHCIQLYYGRDIFGVVVDTNALMVLADLEAIETPYGTVEKEHYHYPHKVRMPASQPASPVSNPHAQSDVRLFVL